MSEEGHDDLLLLGKVIRPHGLDGLLRVTSYARSGKSFLAAGRVFLRTAAGVWSEKEILSISPHKDVFLMRLGGIDSLEGAEPFRGAEVFVSKDVCTRESEEEFFWHEIIGLRVYLKSGTYVGEIRHILPTGGNDIYVVREGDSEILIPAVHEVVELIDLPNRKMVISHVEGLLDLNET